MTSYSFQAQQLADRAHHYSYGDGADAAVATALATEGLVHAVLSASEQLHHLVAAQAPAGPAVIYRATSAFVALGHYSTREQARAHCIADADEHALTDLRWVTDADPDGEPEADDLWGISGSNSEPIDLEYCVTPITVQAAYDPDAEN